MFLSSVLIGVCFLFDFFICKPLQIFPYSWLCFCSCLTFIFYQFQAAIWFNFCKCFCFWLIWSLHLFNYLNGKSLHLDSFCLHSLDLKIDCNYFPYVDSFVEQQDFQHMIWSFWAQPSCLICFCLLLRVLKGSWILYRTIEEAQEWMTLYHLIGSWSGHVRNSLHLLSDTVLVG